MNCIDFSKDWRFAYSQSEDWHARRSLEDAQRVDLPHDFRIALERKADTPAGLSEGFYPGGIGYYEKTFVADKDMVAGGALLYFDGVYRMCEVRLNHDLIATHPGGYTAFFADMTGQLREGKNTVRVKVNASMLPASRWYPGAGIYRAVHLLTAPAPCIEPWSVAVETLSISPESAAIRVKCELYNPENVSCALAFSVYDAQGQPAAYAEADAPHSCTEVTIEIPSPKLWSTEHPHLYTLHSTPLIGGAKGTGTHTRFGVRTVEVDARRGLRINGEPVLLKGGCVHHDNGLLGARSYPSSERRKVQKLLENGYNAVRCAHNPPSTAFLDACDELGMLVIDEAFDCWREGKKLNDEHIFFEDHWGNEIRAMILRDRNHPSVIIWSTGNEIVERSGVSDGALWSKRLADEVRALDATRPVTNALCGFFEDPEIVEMEANSRSTAGEGKDFWASRSEEFVRPLDIVGYNYLLDRYEKDARLYPERVIMGTESFPIQAFENWEAVQKHPFVIGDFVWTAWEYIGESGIGHSRFDGIEARGLKEYPWHLAYCGDLDLCGRKRPQSHYRDFVWSGRKTPYIAVRHPRHGSGPENISPWGFPDIEESWTFPGYEGRDVNVTVYADGDEVALYMGEQLIGRKPCGKAARYIAEFALSYKPGELTAVAYEAGREIGRASLETTKHPAALAFRPESVEPDGLIFADIEVVDEDGRRVPYADNEISVRVHGAGKLIAMGSGDPAGAQNYTLGHGRVWRGRTMIVVEPTGEAGEIRVEARAPYLPALDEILQKSDS